ncbi:MAG: WbqC family protein [Desulfotomaculaceae bacterium]
MTVVAIHQPNFLPWQGYFHKLLSSDIFIFLDDAQFPRGKSFTSRVSIKSSGGPVWLTVPVKGKGDLLPIKDIIMVDTPDWQRKHLKTIENCYAKAPFFKECFPLIKELYQTDDQSLCNFNIKLITNLAQTLTSSTCTARASELDVNYNSPLDYLIKLVKQAGGTKYLTGTGKGSARYLDEEAFRQEGIEVLYQSFVQPSYPQLWGEFIPNLSIIDLLFNCGSVTGKKYLSAG